MFSSVIVGACIVYVLYLIFMRLSYQKKDSERHTLYICTKCNDQKAKLSKEEVKSIEEMGSNSGNLLYKKVIGSFNQNCDWVRCSEVSGSSSSYCFSLAADRNKTLEIVPVKCLSTCDMANCIAFRAAPDKYCYQFGEQKGENISDIEDFAKMYVESDDGFSKSKTRPVSLRKTLLARIPPK